MFDHFEAWLQWVIDACRQRRTKTDANLIDVITAQRGWIPLEVGFHMTVSFDDGKRYKIIREE